MTIVYWDLIEIYIYIALAILVSFSIIICYNVHVVAEVTVLHLMKCTHILMFIIWTISFIEQLVFRIIKFSQIIVIEIMLVEEKINFLAA